MTLPPAARAHRDHAVEAWAEGHYYEAHEILEDLAEAFEEEDPSFEIALALIRAAACLHKLSANVGARAVPGKLAGALQVLKTAPEDWCGLDLGRLVRELEGLKDALAPMATGAPPPAELDLPLLRRA